MENIETPAVVEETAPAAFEAQEQVNETPAENQESTTNNSVDVASEYAEKKPEEDKEKKESAPAEETEKNEAEEKKDDEEDKKKYELLETSYSELKTSFTELQTAFDKLKAENEELLSFKLNIEDAQKDELINSFYMLSDEDKAEVLANKSKYSLDDIEAKLSVICFRKKINFTEASASSTPTVTFNLNADVVDDTPAWISEVEKYKKARDI